mgnify:CR=1 FL=1
MTIYLRYIALLILTLFALPKVNGQTTLIKEINVSRDTIQFDTTAIYRSGFEIKTKSGRLLSTEYWLDPLHARLYIKDSIGAKTVTLQYERIPVNLGQEFKHKSTDIIVTDTSAANFDPFIYSISTNTPNEDLFGSAKLNKQGSISRGITVGNAQSLSLQSTLNLQLDGQIAPNLFMQGSISDDNIPFQPEGNTQKLQEFDQVYLKIYNDDFAVIGGDFWLRKPAGYFLNYAKRTQGVSVEANHDMGMLGFEGHANHKISGAYSKGKFSRNIVQGIEGNQGPYRLIGAENETYIVVLAGTEKVYLDGKLLTRGQEFDYTIDYNTAEIVFTANNLITKDVRLVIEFQYSDLNYARSLFAYNAEIKGEKYNTWINVYSEQDAKNQTIQQSLTDEKKVILSQVDDSLQNAFSNSIDSVGYSENRVLYTLIDTLGIDSVLLFTGEPSLAIYHASFAKVPLGQGNYVFDRYTANGRVYKWVAPIAGVPQGDYEPIQLLIAPQKKQMYVVGTEYYVSKNMKTSVELAMSNHDLNTFSKLDKANNQGVALKWKWSSSNFINKKETIRLNTVADFEFNERTFEPIQWFRSVEFDRDWNVRNKAYSGNQYLSDAGLRLVANDLGGIGYNFENFIWGFDYTGFRHNIDVNLNKKGWKYIADASLLTSNGVENTSYLRHKMDLSKNMKFLKVGFQDIQETNRIRDELSPDLSPVSYRFYDWKTYISTGDSIVNQLSIYYRERYDWFSDSTDLRRATKAQNIGLEGALLKNLNNILKINLNYRKLDVLDTILYQSQPENTILNRIEHVMKLAKGAISTTTFYEIGSGLELKKEYIYLEVNPGQGTHAWIDYNEDGIQDLGEFEVAVFADQGNYIRVFVPTNEYVRTYSNQFSTSLFLRPETVWRSEAGLKKLIARFSNQTIYKINRKTSFENDLQRFNPFVYEISDTSLVSISTNFRNTFYFNKSNSVFGLTYTYQENASKILLSNGFDSRLNTSHEGQLRWNLSKKLSLRVASTLGRKKSNSDYTIGRDYFIEYYDVAPEISYQPNTAIRLAINTKYSEKENQSELKEAAKIKDIGIETRINQAQKGSLTGRLNFIQIDYNASQNSSLAFEMLEGLQPGNNFTWGLTYQRKVAKNLQINFNYNGRKSETSNAIHSGGMELRAFF